MDWQALITMLLPVFEQLLTFIISLFNKPPTPVPAAMTAHASDIVTQAKALLVTVQTMKAAMKQP